MIMCAHRLSAQEGVSASSGGDKRNADAYEITDTTQSDASHCKSEGPQMLHHSAQCNVALPRLPIEMRFKIISEVSMAQLVL